MKAWIWFAVVPASLAAAYATTPGLVIALSGHEATAVTIAQLDLPTETEKPTSKEAVASHDIDYSSFGSLIGGRSVIKEKPTPPPPPLPRVFTLQSILTSGASGVAVIDGNVVRTGDQLGDGFRVAKIDSREVWLTAKRTTTQMADVKVFEGKKVRKAKKPKAVVTEESRVLHFPEYRDIDMQSQRLPSTAANASVQKPGQAELEKDYKQILDKLKL
jgi:hypothetical protein